MLFVATKSKAQVSFSALKYLIRIKEALKGISIFKNKLTIIPLIYTTRSFGLQFVPSIYRYTTFSVLSDCNLFPLKNELCKSRERIEIRVNEFEGTNNFLLFYIPIFLTGLTNSVSWHRCCISLS